MEQILKLVSLNSGSSFVLFGGLCVLLAERRPNIVLCQEVVVGKEKLQTIIAHLGYKVILFHNSLQRAA